LLKRLKSMNKIICKRKYVTRSSTVFFLVWVACAGSSYGQQFQTQLPSIQAPKPANLNNMSVNPVLFPTLPLQHPGIPSFQGASNQPYANRYTQGWNRQVEVMQMFDELERDYLRNLYDFPSISAIPSTQLYHTAFDNIMDMLNGSQPMDLAKAVFLVENAYFDGHVPYEEYLELLDDLESLVYNWLATQGIDASTPTARMYGLHKVFTDTLYMDQPGMEQQRIHYPFEYDFDDFWGREDHSKQFVTKLLGTGNGQCYNLPTLYMILAGRMDIPAWMSFSPSHSFVRLQDENKQWYNLELTNGHLVSDAWVMGSGYITSDAIRNGIYLDTLGTKELVAQQLVDLAMGYKHKFGNDPIIKAAVDSALVYQPNSIQALMVKSNYQTELVEWLWRVRGRPQPQHFENDPRIREILVQRNAIYKQIDNTGYQEMPEEAYTLWLQSVFEEKENQEYNRQFIRRETTN